jgi:hypothetical protein
MTIHRAIHEHWSSYRPLAALVPPEQVYTGLPPIRDAARQPISFPYISLTSEGQSETTHTSSGTMISVEQIRFAVFTKSYDEGRRIAAAIDDYFNRREFNWPRGRVLDIRPAGRSESEDPSDGVWRIASDFLIRFTDTSGSRF